MSDCSSQENDAAAPDATGVTKIMLPQPRRNARRPFPKGRSVMSHAPQAASAEEDPRSFKNEFMQILHTLAIPMFHEFASDARGNSFPSDSKDGVDADGNPYASVRFILDRKAELDADPDNECELVIKGLLGEEKVEINAAYDKRPGKAAAYREKLEIQMINQLGLEDHLTDFLSAAMASRREQPIPPRKREQQAMATTSAPAAAAPAASQPIPIIWKKREK